MSTQTSPASSEPNQAQAARSAQARAFGTSRPRRRLAAPRKAALMSPEDRRRVEQANKDMIDAALAEGRVTRYDAKWADGARVREGFGFSEG